MISPCCVVLDSRHQKVVKQLGKNLGTDLGQAVACLDLPWGRVENDCTNLSSSPCNSLYDVLL
jgi:hypothetical protein